MTEEYQLLTVYVAKGQYERLRRLAFEERRSQAEIVREALDQYLQREKNGSQSSPRS